MDIEQYDLISIIVPVYNVGQALIDKCVNSILEQTYYNLEIILVDDGSTDESGIICDTWSNRDKRVYVIHRRNGGLSAARNTGTERAKGKYILYVDSDDWIDSRMVEFLYHALINTKSDLSICGIYSTDGEKKKPLSWYEEDCVLDNDIAYAELINNTRITSHAWNKLYKAEIIKEIPFPEGKLYEDIRMMHKVFKKCSKVAIVKEHLYNYYRRSNSIAMSPKLYNKLEFSAAFAERYEYVKKFTPQFSERVLSQMASSISLSMVQNTYTKEELSKYKKELLEIKKFLKRKDVKCAVYKFYSRNQKIYYLMARVCPDFGNSIYRIFLKKFTRRYKEWS